MQKKPYLSFLVPLLFTLLFSSAVQAQSQQIEMTVSAGLGGHAKFGEWLPVHVSIENSGSDINGELRVSLAQDGSESIFAVAADLPSGARKVITLDIRPPTFTKEVTVQLLSEDSILSDAAVEVDLHRQNEYLLAVLSDNTDNYSGLSALDFKNHADSFIIPFSLRDMPDRPEMLRSYDALVISDVDTTALTPDQGMALHEWVLQGGRLLVGGGTSAERLVAGLPDDLLPVTLGNSAEISTLNTLADYVDTPILLPGPFPAIFPATTTGQAIIAHNSEALLTRQQMGKGLVYYLALDPGSEPFTSWSGNLAFWEKMLKPESSKWTNDRPNDISPLALESGQMSMALNNLPVLDLPSIRILAVLFGLYILLIGPVNFLILRRLKKLDWAWVTIPLLTLLFSLGSYGIGYGTRGNEVIVNQISIIPLSSTGGNPTVRNYVGLFSPSRSDYNISVPGDTLISSIGSDLRFGFGPGTTTSGGTLDVLQGDPAQIRSLAVNQWSMQSFQAESLLTDQAMTLENDIRIEGGKISGTLRNGIGRNLEEIILLNGTRYARLGDLAAGEDITLDISFESNNGAPFPYSLYNNFNGSSPTRVQQRRQLILEAYFQTNFGPPGASNNLMLFAWTDFIPLELEVDQVQISRQQTTLVTIDVPITLRDGRINLPPGSLVGTVETTKGDAGECGAGRVYLGGGSAILAFQLPTSVQGLQIEELALSPSIDGPPQLLTLPDIELYDWENQAWVMQDEIEAGDTRIIEQPERFIDETAHTIRLQASSGNQQGGCSQFDFALVGKVTE